jgi:hypothetical protein
MRTSKRKQEVEMKEQRMYFGIRLLLFILSMGFMMMPVSAELVARLPQVMQPNFLAFTEQTTSLALYRPLEQWLSLLLLPRPVLLSQGKHRRRGVGVVLRKSVVNPDLETKW